MEGLIQKNIDNLEYSRDLQKIDTTDLLVSYDFNSFYPSAQADKTVHGR